MIKMEVEVIEIKGDWPYGISDGLVSPCSICGKRDIKFDYLVDDEFWDTVVRKDLRNTVICLDCLDKIAKSQGKTIGEHIKFIQFTGERETIVLKPVKIYRY